MKNSKLYQIIIILSLSSQIYSQINTDIWHNYINDPCARNYLICVNQIEREFPNSDWSTVLLPFWSSFYEENLYVDWLKRMSIGDVLAIDLWVRFYPYIEYGEPKEEFNIWIGKLMKKDPELFFILYTTHFPSDTLSVYSKRHLDVFIGVLDFDAEYFSTFENYIKEWDDRIKALKTVTNPRFKYLQDLCIGILEQKKQEMIDFLKENPDAKP